MSVDLELLEAERICYVFVARLIAGFGIVGNLLSLFTLRRKSLNDSPYTYLTALSVADLLVLILMSGIGIIRCGNCYLNDQQIYAGRVFEYFVYLPIINMAHHSSTFITLAMTIERFVFVRCPLRAKKLCTKSKAKLSIFIAVIVAIGINLPRFFMFRLHQIPRLPGTVVFSEISSFVILECIVFLPYTNDTETIPQCTFIEIGSVDKNLMPVMKRNYLERNDSIVIESSEDLQKLIDRYRVPINSIQIKKCQKFLSNRKMEIEESEEGLYTISNGTFIPIEDYSEKGLFQPQNYFLNHSQYFSFFTTKKEIFMKEQVTVRLNFTNVELLKPFEKKYPCLINNNKNNLNVINLTSTILPDVIQASAPVLIQTTPYYNSMSYWVHFSIVVLEVLATIIMATLNVALIRLINKSNSNRQKLMPTYSVNSNQNSVYGIMYKQHQNDQQRLTITFILITSLTSIATFLSAITSNPVAEQIYGPNFENNKTYRWARMANNITSLINNSINFAVYALFNTRFRKEFRLAFISLVQSFHFLSFGKRPKGNAHKCLHITASNSSVNTIFSEVSANYPLSITTFSREGNLNFEDVAL